VGASAITPSHTTATGFPKDNLVDDRAGTLFKWAASYTDPTIDVDLGATFVADGLSGLERLIIPANHNIDSIYVQGDTTSGFSSPTALHATPGSPDTDHTAGTLIDIEFDTTSSSEQYIRIGIKGTAQYYLPQIVMTKIVTIGVGPKLEESIDSKVDNTTQIVQPTGLRPSVQHGPQQRVLEYLYENPLESTDLAAMEALVAAVGLHTPFYVDPASWTPFDAPLAVKFNGELPESRHSVLSDVASAAAKNYRLRLIESLD
jgi:hypothetical protein